MGVRPALTNEQSMSRPQENRGRALLMAVEFPPLGGGGVLRATKLARYLPGEGWRLSVLCTEELWVAHRDPSLLAEIPASVTVHRIPRPFSRPKQSAAGRMHSSANEGILRSIGRGLRRVYRSMIQIPDPFVGWAIRASRVSRSSAGDPDVIIASGPPHSMLFGGALLARRLSRPLVMDYRDEWTLSPFYRTAIPWRSVLERWIERWGLRRAAMVVFVSEASAARYREAFPEMADRCAVIPNGYDPADFVDLPPYSPYVPGDDRPIRIGHFGSLHDRRDPTVFLAALGRIVGSPPGDLPPIELVLAGIIGTNQERLARQLVPARHLAIEPFKAHREALKRMASCDILLVLSNHEEAGPAALTGKIFEYLGMGRPILAIVPDGPAADLLKAARAGISASPEDPVEVEASILRAVRLASDPASFDPDLDVVSLYDRRRQAADWARLLARVVEKSAIRV